MIFMNYNLIMMVNKFIFIILLFPLASLAQGNYTEGVSKVTEVLYNNSQTKKDVDAALKEIEYQTPDYIVKPMRILLPTIVGLVNNKFELKYVRSF